MKELGMVHHVSLVDLVRVYSDEMDTTFLKEDSQVIVERISDTSPSKYKVIVEIVKFDTNDLEQNGIDDAFKERTFFTVLEAGFLKDALPLAEKMAEEFEIKVTKNF